jgi:type VI secretion system protein ImpG
VSEHPLLRYYEQELVFIRKLAGEFAAQYPKVAPRLQLEENRSLDPHVERLIQAFALLAGRIRHKLDDEFPELTDALLSVLYPHYLAPVPSMAVVQFEPDPTRLGAPEGFLVAKGSKLKTNVKVKGRQCEFRTGYPVRLWPIELTEARLLTPPFTGLPLPPNKAAAAVRLRLECTGALSFAELTGLERLRFFLSGGGFVTAGLYELLLNNAMRVVFRAPDAAPGAKPIDLKPSDCLSPVGFEPEDGLLPYPRHSFPGYRLLTEFFAFPAKFLFFDLGCFDRLRMAGFGKKLEVILYLDRLEREQRGLAQAVDATTFRLGATPVVNLFEQTAEPIDLTHTRSEYFINPEAGHCGGMEVYAVNSVKSVDPTENKETIYQPFYSFRHGGTRHERRTFWYAARRPALPDKPAVAGAKSEESKASGTEVFLNLVDLDFNPSVPGEPRLIVHTLCTNRDLPALLSQSGTDQFLDLEQAAPLRGPVRCLRMPTVTLRPRAEHGLYWRLVSHLSLNHLSLTDPGGQGDDGRAALQEILRLYDFSDGDQGQELAAVNEQLVEGILKVASKPTIGRTGAPTSSGFCRGTEVTIEFDEEKYVGTGLYLFASVLERFLGLYVSVNSFSQLVAVSRQRTGPIKRWPPRAGEQPLL